MEKTIRYIVNLLLVSLFMLTIAVNRNAKIWGTEVTKLVNPDKTETGSVYLPKDSAGIMIFNSTEIAKDISGFGGPVPLKMYISEEKVLRIELLSNAETPEFLKEVINTGLLSKWDGVRLTDIGSEKVDAVSGATMTSSAIISTVKRVADIAQDRLIKDEIIPQLSLKSVFAILVILSGVILAFLKTKSKVARTILLILNVCVLGFWCGSFLSLSLLINWFSNGINLTVALVPFLLLLSAIILPLFGKKNNYCNYHCPMGSLQELASKCTHKKVSVPNRIEKSLSYLRDIILYTILALNWIGVGFEIVDYEVFSAFLFNNASLFVLITGALFLILSFFINRPYCRYICPTGSLIRFSQQTNK